MRQLPAAEPRVETGAVQFGDDWPGLFIRGDNCIPLRFALEGLKSEVDNLPDHVALHVGQVLYLLGVIDGDVMVGP